MKIQLGAASNRVTVLSLPLIWFPSLSNSSRFAAFMPLARTLSEVLLSAEFVSFLPREIFARLQTTYLAKPTRKLQLSGIGNCFEFADLSLSQLFYTVVKQHAVIFFNSSSSTSNQNFLSPA